REFFCLASIPLLSTRGRSLGLGAIHEILQLSAGLEEGNFLGGHFYFRSGLGIAANSPAALPGAETSESPDFDFLALLQRLDDAIENSFDDGLRLLPRKLGDAQDLFDEVGLRKCGLLSHRRYASSRNSRLKTASLRPSSYGRRERRPSRVVRSICRFCAFPKRRNQTAYGGLAPRRSAPFLSLK